jgi:hypothetical protein
LIRILEIPGSAGWYKRYLDQRIGIRVTMTN